MAGEPPHISVEFDLDVNGILKVSATDRGSHQAKQTTLHAAHTRLSPSDQAASAHYLDGLWEAAYPGADAEAEPLGELAETGDADPLLARAYHLLDERASELNPLADLVRRLEAARREGREEAAAELGDQLLNMLYDLEGDEGIDEP